MFKLSATGCHKLHSIFPGEKYNESDSGEDAGDAGSMFSQVVRPGDIFDDGADDDQGLYEMECDNPA